jgi:hypothetical protein
VSDQPQPQTQTFPDIDRLCCGVTGPVTVTYKLTVKPLGSYSLSGGQLKASAYWWPWARCENCGHESEGRPASSI